jgi:hypothetical protein
MKQTDVLQSHSTGKSQHKFISKFTPRYEAYISCPHLLLYYALYKALCMSALEVRQVLVNIHLFIYKV